MAEDLLDGDQIKPGSVQLRGGIVAQHIGSQGVGPGRQMFRGGLGKPHAQGVVADPFAAAVGVTPLRWEQRRSRASVFVVEVAPHVGHEPRQRGPRVVD